MKTVTIADLQHDVTHYVELAEAEDILILNNSKPVGFLRGFVDEDDLFDYQLETDPRFFGAREARGHSSSQDRASGWKTLKLNSLTRATSDSLMPL